MVPCTRISDQSIRRCQAVIPSAYAFTERQGMFELLHQSLDEERWMYLSFPYVAITYTFPFLFFSSFDYTLYKQSHVGLENLTIGTGSQESTVGQRSNNE
jgi:hypothetical protein